MPAAPIADVPPSTLAPFRGPSTTVHKMLEHVAGPRGERSVLVRNCAEHAIRHVQPKDYLSEIVAVRNWVAEHCYFTNDALTTEWVKDPERICEEVVRYGRARIDCDDYASLLAAMLRSIGREVEFVVVGFGAEGNYSHVLTRVREPKSGRWIVVDPVAGTTEGQMLRRVKTSRTYQIGAASPYLSGLGSSNPCSAGASSLCPGQQSDPYPMLGPAAPSNQRTIPVPVSSGSPLPAVAPAPGDQPRHSSPAAAAPAPVPPQGGVRVGGILLAAAAVGTIAYMMR